MRGADLLGERCSAPTAHLSGKGRTTRIGSVPANSDNGERAARTRAAVPPGRSGQRGGIAGLGSPIRLDNRSGTIRRQQ